MGAAIKKSRQTSHALALRWPSFMNRATGRKLPNDTGWQDRHIAALHSPMGFEAAIVSMLVGWAAYADEHNARYDSHVTDDGVLGDEWVAIGRGIRTLLNGETGRLDCGTLDAFVCDVLEFEGAEVD